MNDIFDLTEQPAQELFYTTNNPNDSRLGEVVSTDIKNYEQADICILGFQKNEKFDSDSIRQEFYQLTNFGVNKKILDLGNVRSDKDYPQIIEKVLAGKQTADNHRCRKRTFISERKSSRECFRQRSLAGDQC